MESASGEEAVALYSRSATMIDMVITDVNLGGPTNGWDVQGYACASIDPRWHPSSRRSRGRG
jgi:hypothetical protein